MESTSSDKRGAVLASAERIFLERGLTFSTEDLAREARTSKRTVYEAFGSKEGLVRAILKSMAARIDKAYEEAYAADLSFAAWLRGLLLAAAGRYDPVTVLRVREVERALPGLWKEFSDWSAEGWDKVAAALARRAAIEGLPQPDAACIEIVLAGFHRELAARGFRLADGRGPDAALEALASLLLKALGTQEASA